MTARAIYGNLMVGGVAAVHRVIVSGDYGILPPCYSPVRVRDHSPRAIIMPSTRWTSSILPPVLCTGHGAEIVTSVSYPVGGESRRNVVSRSPLPQCAGPVRAIIVAARSPPGKYRRIDDAGCGLAIRRGHQASAGYMGSASDGIRTGSYPLCKGVVYDLRCRPDVDWPRSVIESI